MWHDISIKIQLYKISIIVNRQNLVNQKIVKSSSTKFSHFRLAVSQEKICRCSFESDALRLSILAVATILILHIPKTKTSFFFIFVHLFFNLDEKLNKINDLQNKLFFDNVLLCKKCNENNNLRYIVAKSLQ